MERYLKIVLYIAILSVYSAILIKYVVNYYENCKTVKDFSSQFFIRNSYMIRGALIQSDSVY